MAVAAYASLISLTHLLNNVHHRAELHNIHADIKQIETLQKGVNYLVKFLQLHSRSEDQRLKGLWRQISEVAFETEQIFDFHVVNQLQDISDPGQIFDLIVFNQLQKRSDFGEIVDLLVGNQLQQSIFYLVVVNQLQGKCDRLNLFCFLMNNRLQEGYGPVDFSYFLGDNQFLRKIFNLLKNQVLEISHHEETLELFVLNQLQERSDLGDKSDFIAFCKDVERMIQKVDFIKTEVSVIGEVQADLRIGRQPKVSVSIGASSGPKNVMVGFDEHVFHVMDELTTDIKGHLKIIPITGMGGIGKTTLAKNVFDNPYISNHFDMKIWLTISQDYSVHDILIGLLNNGEVKRKSENLSSLGQRLYQKLFDRRYLIVMDDVWAVEAWDEFKIFFPDNGNGSRIIMTTRLANVATSLGSSNPYSISFLDEERSWNLFCQTIFGQEGCSFQELEKIGKKIAKSCRGLPLEIIAIGGLLANSNMTREFWESVAENLSSFAKSGYEEHCLKILSLSYSNLPIHLKPCFLYMWSYPEDHEINVLELIKRRVAEGFIEPADDRSLEEIAMEYVKDLISRNLIFIHAWALNGEVETCGVHDLLRDLCLREFDKEHFIRSPKVQCLANSIAVCFQCGESIYSKEAMKLHNFVLISPSSSQVSLFVCGACRVICSRLTKPRLVRIFNDNNGEKLVHATQLRHFSAVIWNSNFISPSVLHLLWNLQIFKIDLHGGFGVIVLPNGIWKLPELRHLEIGGRAILPNPVDNDVEGKDFFILKNLQTLSNIQNLKCTKDVLDRIPNLKNLGITYKDERKDIRELSKSHSLFNLAQLQTVKSLYMEKFVLEGIIFPNSLKQLELTSCRISWKDMSIIGLLPNLEILVLFRSGEGSEWAPLEGEFLQLRVLVIFRCNLVLWRADWMHFPKLEKLKLWELDLLEEIPLGIGDIETLHTVELCYVRESVVNSANQIWEEQQSMGNESLQIHATNSDGIAYQIGASVTE